MKMYIKSTSQTTTHIEVIVDIELFGKDPIAASVYKGIQIPDGPVISGVPEAIYDSDTVVNFEGFIESVRELITDFYKLDLYYKNESPDKSNYFGMLAKDKNGNIILDFDFTLRVATHDPKRTEKSKHQKKLQEEALKERIGDEQIKHIRHTVTVNSKKFTSYIQAFAYIDSIVEKSVMSMKQNEKYRKKIK